ncbi:MAG: S1 RNA-binding domain-containing protein [bacterium]|nr:S1 RNA-binding domain-containing protein [bacterium]
MTETINTGDIVTGEITHVAEFGAFMVLPDGKDGLVHISEIANEFVKDINQFVKIGDKVKVKIMGLNKQGKYELSMKRTEEEVVEEKPAMFLHSKSSDDHFEDKITSYMKRSEERQIDIRRNLKKKQGIAKRRR